MKGDHIVTRMIFTIKWKTGDVFRIYSPKEKKCQSRFKKWLGWLLICAGTEIILGKNGWKAYENGFEDDGNSVSR